MGSIIDKLDYTVKSIQDINKALAEKGISTTPFTFGFYGDLIRLIKTDPGVKTGSFGGTGSIIIDMNHSSLYKPTINFINASQRIFDGKIPMSYPTNTQTVVLRKPTINFIDIIQKEEV